MLKRFGILPAFSSLLLLFFCGYASAQDRIINLKAEDIRSRANLLFAPASGNFLTDSTFDVSLVVDTRGNSVNAVEVNVRFPADKLQVVKPISGRSIVAIWTDQPRYSNNDGTIAFSGVVPGGINTSNGVVATVTFRAVKAGTAVIRFAPTSKVLANDGQGTDITDELGTAIYEIKPRPPRGPRIFSETHPFQDTWYNNNSPVLAWEKEDGVTDFSYALDKNPNTVPDNLPETQATAAVFENLADGLYYFHLKAKKNGLWGSATDFLVRIDATPPAEFKPTVDVTADKGLISFFTTDAASGVDHFEVAVIKRSDALGGSPIFIEAQNPYQLPKSASGRIRVIVRAIDKAGNVRDASADADIQTTLLSWLAKNIVILLILALGLVFALFAEHILIAHKRTMEKLKLAWQILKERKPPD